MHVMPITLANLQKVLSGWPPKMSRAEAVVSEMDGRGGRTVQFEVVALKKI